MASALHSAVGSSCLLKPLPKSFALPSISRSPSNQTSPSLPLRSSQQTGSNGASSAATATTTLRVSSCLSRPSVVSSSSSFSRPVRTVPSASHSSFTPSLKQWTLGSAAASPRTAGRREVTACVLKMLSNELGKELPSSYANIGPRPPSGRRAGVLFHPTCLPGPYGCGELGKEAFEFVDFVARTGSQIWQVLPLVPPERVGWSPYSGTDSNSGNTLLISLDKLVEDGLLGFGELPPAQPLGKADFNKIAEWKDPLLSSAAKRLLQKPTSDPLFIEYQVFRKAPKTAAWLEDAALFASIENKLYPGKDWWDWPEDLRSRNKSALAKVTAELKDDIDEYVALQFLFQKQWLAVKKYANDKGIKIVGDMPIYVNGHSSDVWQNPKLWDLDSTGKPALISGVPPDAFSATGQLWGSPLYDWQEHKRENFNWWSRRLGRALELYDEMRIDHFRALAAYYAIDADAETAMNGKWRLGPNMDFFNAIKKNLGDFPIIAEDLGVITDDVVDLRLKAKLPGMCVLLFGWSDQGDNTNLPHNYEANSVCYPGTHDNDTVKGWYDDSSTPEQKEQIKDYLNSDGTDISWDFIRACLNSVSKTVVVQLQDILSLGNEARMNVPGVQGGWSWRIPAEFSSLRDLSPQADRFNRLLEVSDRLAKKPATAKK